MVLRQACVLAVAAALGSAVPDAAAASAALTGAAGIGGAAKPGRWTPIAVTVHAQGGPVDGVLLARWGNASSQRRVSIQDGARKTFEFYLHTMEPGSAVNVRFLPASACDVDAVCAETAALATVDLPVRTVAPADPFTLCVGVTGSAGGPACTANITPEALPRSFRGFDAVDDLKWLTAEAALPPAQEAALARWRSLRALDTRGDLAATDRPASIMPALGRKNRTPPAARLIVASYAVFLLIAAFAVRRHRTWIAATAIVALIAIATASAAAAGRLGPGSAIVIHHATLVQQLPAAAGALVTLRGAAEYPAFDRYDLQATIEDGAIEAGPHQLLGDNGYPTLHGRRGAGAREAFALEGAVEKNLLTVTRDGPSIRIGNTSGGDLRECRLSAAGGEDVIERLAPGATIVADLRGESFGPIVACLMPAPPVTFAEPHRQVITAGRTILVAYLDPAEGR